MIEGGGNSHRTEDLKSAAYAPLREAADRSKFNKERLERNSLEGIAPSSGRESTTERQDSIGYTTARDTRPNHKAHSSPDMFLLQGLLSGIVLDMTTQQDSLSGVIICPVYWWTAVKGELRHHICNTTILHELQPDEQWPSWLTKWANPLELAKFTAIESN
jgi:hypothetical protein